MKFCVNYLENQNNSHDLLGVQLLIRVTKSRNGTLLKQRHIQLRLIDNDSARDGEKNNFSPWKIAESKEQFVLWRIFASPNFISYWSCILNWLCDNNNYTNNDRWLTVCTIVSWSCNLKYDKCSVGVWIIANSIS